MSQIHESHPVQIRIDNDRFDGDLAVPPQPRGVVVFAHGSGSGRRSPRNLYVAGTLFDRGFATLLIDLLTPREAAADEQTALMRFDVALLGERLITIGDWISQEPAVEGVTMGLFGASTGAGAALVAAARRPDLVAAIVSRGGRPDLSGAALQRVRAPTLLIVGGRDELVIDLNYGAMDAIRCTVDLKIVSGATHLFEEPGALEQVATLAGDWFERHLGARPRAA